MLSCCLCQDGVECIMEDSKNSLEFTGPENKIRKKWLFWSTLLPVFVLGGLKIIVMFRLFMAADFMTMMGILLLFLFSAGGWYINYHCAYKNPGTMLLLLGIIGISLNLLTTFLKPENLALMKVSVGASLFMLMTVFFQITVLYYSYKLRKINKKMQERRLIASPVYINALSVLSTAINLEELNEQFTRLRTAHDSGSGVEALAKAYDQQKKILRLASSST